jgi:hypothetical protein
MFGSRKKKPSLFRRLLYLLVLLTGGSGVGGWVFKDHPVVQSVWTLVTGQTPDQAAQEIDQTLKNAVGEVLKPPDPFTKPGTYQVTIPEVHLDSTLFKAGHTVDIQARVIKVGPNGRDTLLWDSKEYGERLAVVGKDELVAGWPHRPFQIEWSPGQQIIVEVFDRRPGLFVEPRRFYFTPPDNQARQFPLRPGTFALEPTERPNPPVDPRNNQIVLQCERVGDLPGGRYAETRPTSHPPARTADAGDDADAGSDRPIIIK